MKHFSNKSESKVQNKLKEAEATLAALQLRIDATNTNVEESKSLEKDIAIIKKEKDVAEKELAVVLALIKSKKIEFDKFSYY